MTNLQYATGHGASALDQQQERDRLDGYAVVSGYGVSPGTGLEVEVASGTALFGVDANGNANTVSSGSTQTVALASADSSDPRKDVIYVQSDGTVTKETGVARSELPSGATRFQTYQPEPYSMHDLEGVVLAEVWVGAGETSLSTNDIRDRRMSATATHEKIVSNEIVATSASVEEIGNSGSPVSATDPLEVEQLQTSIHTPTGDRDPNNPVDIQPLLDGFTDFRWNAVILDPDLFYAAVDIPRNTAVFMNGAQIRVLNDETGVELAGRNSYLIGPGTVTTSPVTDYTSDAVLVDTSTIGDKLGVEATPFGQVGVYNNVRLAGGSGDTTHGTALRLRAQTDPIALGNTFDISVSNFDNHVAVETNNGNWVNGPKIYYEGGRYQDECIIHENNEGSSERGKVLVYGSLQTSPNGPAIRNHTVEPSVIFHGQIFDASDPDPAVQGPHIKIISPGNRVDADMITWGPGTTTGGMGQEALAGGQPDATVYAPGEIVEDTDNPGTLWLRKASREWEQIAP